MTWLKLRQLGTCVDDDNFITMNFDQQWLNVAIDCLRDAKMWKACLKIDETWICQMETPYLCTRSVITNYIYWVLTLWQAHGKELWVISGQTGFSNHRLRNSWIDNYILLHSLWTDNKQGFPVSCKIFVDQEKPQELQEKLLLFCQDAICP